MLKFNKILFTLTFALFQIELSVGQPLTSSPLLQSLLNKIQERRNYETNNYQPPVFKNPANTPSQPSSNTNLYKLNDNNNNIISKYNSNAFANNNVYAYILNRLRIKRQRSDFGQVNLNKRSPGPSHVWRYTWN